MPAPAPAPTIAGQPLLPQARIPRLPLDRWAAQLADALQGARAELRQPRALAAAVAQVANNAALVAVYRGEAEAARRLCEGQMRWQARMSRRARDPRISAFVVQPWINLGRLEAMAGDWASAVSRFARLNERAVDGRLCLGPERVAPLDGETERVAGVCYVGDTLGAYLQAGRHDDALAFAARVRAAAVPALALRAAEGEVVAACRAGDGERAQRVAGEGGRACGGWKRLVFHLRAAEALACDGRMDEAAERLAALAETAGRVSEDSRRPLHCLHILLRLAGACREAGLDAHAAALARDTLAGARAADDEAMRIESLRILAAASAPPERAARRRELAALEAATEYRRYRRAAPAESPVFTGLAGALDALFVP
jgi:hypothetical protein